MTQAQEIRIPIEFHHFGKHDKSLNQYDIGIFNSKDTIWLRTDSLTLIIDSNEITEMGKNNPCSILVRDQEFEYSITIVNESFEFSRKDVRILISRPRLRYLKARLQGIIIIAIEYGGRGISSSQKKQRIKKD